MPSSTNRISPRIPSIRVCCCTRSIIGLTAGIISHPARKDRMGRVRCGGTTTLANWGSCWGAKRAAKRILRSLAGAPEPAPRPGPPESISVANTTAPPKASGGGLVPPWTYPGTIEPPQRAIFDHCSLFNSDFRALGAQVGSRVILPVERCCGQECPRSNLVSVPRCARSKGRGDLPLTAKLPHADRGGVETGGHFYLQFGRSVGQLFAAQDAHARQDAGITEIVFGGTFGLGDVGHELISLIGRKRLYHVRHVVVLDRPQQRLNHVFGRGVTPEPCLAFAQVAGR